MMKATTMDATKLHDVFDGEGTMLDVSSHRSTVGNATDNRTRSSDDTPVVITSEDPGYPLNKVS